ncbi:DNA-directed RNA polymerase I subunit RPA2 [Trichinella patagoniensis]|uniref:DNA-directed RNA polymerase subunit beta n=1 Tax=Trichinella patagoniensis TaxID=990121 RepID=A0A0V0ZA09_9BILA|nr:DNA-directed RNA polymerase I subunit RPA2 [Trichinella patagoniensis]
MYNDVRNTITTKMINAELVEPHIKSFNYFAEQGITQAVEDIFPVVSEISEINKVIEISITNPFIGFPAISKDGGDANALKLWPSECRVSCRSYSAKLLATLTIKINNQVVDSARRNLGDIPIMLMSNRCHLTKLNPNQLMKEKEEMNEMGGYFIVNGQEKVVRMLIAQRRNYPLALVRPKWKQRGQYYTQYGISLRCVRDNHTVCNHIIHYLSNRRMLLRLNIKHEQFYVPLLIILKAIYDCPDQFLYTELMRGFNEDEFWKGCVVNMLMDLKSENLNSKADALSYLGRLFRAALPVITSTTNMEAGQILIDRYLCVHLNTDREKFDFLIYSAQKLCSLAKEEIVPESPDSIANQEVLLPGMILLLILKERLEIMLTRMCRYIVDSIICDSSHQFQARHITTAVKFTSLVTRALEYFLRTGNLPSNVHHAFSQQSGFCIIAERLNHLRFVGHFRGIHRGAFFSEVRSTDVRKLSTEAWGFICPVHTPDGSPCGLLNHLAASCRVTATQGSRDLVIHAISKFGLLSLTASAMLNLDSATDQYYYRVIVDGSVIGVIGEENVQQAIQILRKEKSSGVFLSIFTEICFFSRKTFGMHYPGLFIFTEFGRFMRPVNNLSIEPPSNREYIGTMEQLFLGICIGPEDFEEGVTTHQEIDPANILSFNAKMIPFPDHNQSPRNVYQCQMAKQTMGTPVHSLVHRTDNKMYCLRTPQSPLVKTESYDAYAIDNYPLGTNAIVAVISYTGYDMEDAMIINKASVERGFAHACIYKTERINLNDRLYDGRNVFFHRDPADATLSAFVDEDGLPQVGKLYKTGSYMVKRYHSSEDAYVDNIKIIGSASGAELLKHICVTFRVIRNPFVGDKFASRHGQKGINSFLWPAENMPFTESGMVPDIIFNPHGFPSRMTVGMMIESMAGKSAALHGIKHDATPFKFSDEHPAIEYFGQLLTKAGYNYYGNERMYSGIDGRMLEVDIFFGVVYYQRLRHMVSDKFQVRATGTVDLLTKQPVQGRKRGGGIRFGEMERDSLISHGTAFLLHDRLFDNSDKDYACLCTGCGRLISTNFKNFWNNGTHQAPNAVVSVTSRMICVICKTSDNIEFVQFPYVLKYLIAELSSTSTTLHQFERAILKEHILNIQHILCNIPIFPQLSVA